MQNYLMTKINKGLNSYYNLNPYYIAISLMISCFKIAIMIHSKTNKMFLILLVISMNSMAIMYFD